MIMTQTMTNHNEFAIDHTVNDTTDPASLESEQTDDSVPETI